MKAINFPEANINVAEKQEQYETLPARVYDDQFGEVISCWELSEEELEEVMKTKKIWLSMLTFQRGITPVMLMAEKPQMEDRLYGINDEGMICLRTPDKGGE